MGEARSTTQTADAAWDVGEAARFLGVAPKTLYKLAASGAVPSFKVGSLRRFDPAKLSAWREAQQGGGGR